MHLRFLLLLSLALVVTLASRCSRSNPCASPSHCCSTWGWCGVTTGHCGAGCQSGPCIGSPSRPPPPPPPTTGSSTTPSPSGNPHSAIGHVVSGFFPAWDGRISDIQWNRITHLNLAFVLPTTTGGLTYPDNVNSIADQLVRARPSGSCVRLIISIGGASAGTATWRSLANNPSYRAAFVNNVDRWISDHRFDGVDIDWEFPTQADKHAELHNQLYARLNPKGKEVSGDLAATDWFGKGFKVNQLQNGAHYWNIMAYDYRGSWSIPNDIGSHSNMQDTQGSVNYWRGRGFPASKLVLGVPFYGREFVGSTTRDYEYKAIVQRYPSQTNNPATDQIGQLYFNGVSTIKAKTRYARQQNLAGIMYWEDSQDTRDNKSLLKAINDAIPADCRPKTGGRGSAQSSARAVKLTVAGVIAIFAIMLVALF